MSIAAFPFVLAAFLLSMLALGIYHAAKFLLVPAFMLYDAASVVPKCNEEMKLLKNPVVVMSNQLMDIADWKI